MKSKEEQLEYIEGILGESVSKLLKTAKMHPHLKTLFTSQMVDYAAVKDNVQLLLRDSGLEGVNAFSSKKDIELAIKKRDDRV